MIKFFSHIRKSPLMESKTSKPLLLAGRDFKLAIGEIILVVIGILIALSINNWNSNRIQKQKEAVYLANIMHDLKEQLETIESQMNYEKYISEAAKPILSYYQTH